jgi:ribosomal protein S18 acetylase RimI-like enzyme
MIGSTTPVHTPQQWDSDMLGVACGHIDFPAAGADGPALGRAVLEATPVGEALTVVKVPSTHPRALAELIRSGGKLVGSEITFCSHHPVQAESREIEVEVAGRFDGNEFLALAEVMRFSRFVLDEDIPSGAAVNLWRESIANHCGGRASALVIGRVGGRPAGLVAAMDTDAERNLALVGVLPGYQGRGVGLAMLEAAVRTAGSRLVRVEAFANNVSAVRLYGKVGFVFESEHYVVHLWRGGLHRAPNQRPW